MKTPSFDLTRIYIDRFGVTYLPYPATDDRIAGVAVIPWERLDAPAPFFGSQCADVDLSPPTCYLTSLSRKFLVPTIRGGVFRAQNVAMILTSDDYEKVIFPQQCSKSSLSFSGKSTVSKNRQDLRSTTTFTGSQTEKDITANDQQPKELNGRNNKRDS